MSRFAESGGLKGHASYSYRVVGYYANACHELYPGQLLPYTICPPIGLFALERNGRGACCELLGVIRRRQWSRKFWESRNLKVKSRQYVWSLG